MSAWGILTTVDLLDCDKKIITSKKKLVEYCKIIVNAIKMTPYQKPIIKYFGTDIKIKGYSVVQFIETSLISGHFVDETGDACIDIFSCKDYDSLSAATVSANFFNTEKFLFKRIERG